MPGKLQMNQYNSISIIIAPCRNPFSSYNLWIKFVEIDFGQLSRFIAMIVT